MKPGFRKILWLLGLGAALSLPPSFYLVPSAYARPQGSEQTLREVTREELVAAIATAVRNQPQLAMVLREAWQRGLHPWFMGGTASAIAFYAKEKLQRGEEIPREVHFFDIFSPGQDVDIAIDAPYQQVQTFLGWVQTQELLKMNIEGKIVWDFLTLRLENNRGYVGSPRLFLQNTDSLSLGTLQVPSFDEGAEADLRYTPSFDENPQTNPFVESVLKGEIAFLEKDTHKESVMYRKGMNPEVVSVLRIINKASRHHLNLDNEADAKLLRIVKDYLENNEPKNGSNHDYIRGRMQRIVREMLIGSRDAKQTVAFLRRYQVNRILQRAGVVPVQLNEIVRLERAIVELGRGLSLNGLRRVPINVVQNLPEGSVVEGTTLFGGARPPVLVRPSRLRASEEIVEIMNLVHQATEANAISVAKQVSVLVKAHMDKIVSGKAPTPIFHLSDMSSACSKDCRDYAIVGNLILAAANVSSHITSVKAYTKVIAEIAGREYLLNTHTGDASLLPDTYRPEYIQNVWVPEGALYVATDGKPRSWLLTKMLERVPALIPPLTTLENVINDDETLKEMFRERLLAHLEAGNLDYIFSWEAYYGLLPAETNRSEIGDAAERGLAKTLGEEPSSERAAEFIASLGRLDAGQARLPETMRILKVVDYVVKTSPDDLNAVAVKLLRATDRWVSPNMRKTLFTMLIKHIDVERDLQGLSWRAMRVPSLDRLPLAKAFALHREQMLFESENAEAYRDLSFEDAKALMEFDTMANAKWSRSSADKLDTYNRFLRSLLNFSKASLTNRDNYLKMLSHSLALGSGHELQRWGTASLPILNEIFFQTNDAEFRLMSDDLKELLDYASMIRFGLIKDAPLALRSSRYRIIAGIDRHLQQQVHGISREKIEYLSTYLRKFCREPGHRKEEIDHALLVYEYVKKYYKKYAYYDHVEAFTAVVRGNEKGFVHYFGNERFGALVNDMLTNLDANDSDQRRKVTADALRALNLGAKASVLPVHIEGDAPTAIWVNQASQHFAKLHQSKTTPEDLSELLRSTDRLLTPEGIESWAWVDAEVLANFKADDIRELPEALVREIWTSKHVFLQDISHKDLMKFWLAFRNHPYVGSKEFVAKYPKIVGRISGFLLAPGQDERVRDRILNQIAEHVKTGGKASPLTVDIFARWLKKLRSGGYANGQDWLEREVKLRQPKVYEAVKTIYESLGKEILGREMVLDGNFPDEPGALCQKYLQQLM
ncbi:MAG TPA: hypothetical protein VM901_03280 [Bdellovibrionota bacterium]|nr:hypothetical protein [Bdellovibrionota bacterium]